MSSDTPGFARKPILGSFTLDVKRHQKLLGRVKKSLSTSQEIREKEALIVELRAEIARLHETVNHEQGSDDQSEAYKLLQEKIKSEYAIKAILERINERAHGALCSSQELQGLFRNNTCDLFVVSIDIRGSTEMMLQAIDPEKFAFFIVDLCQAFRERVKEHHGIFDKFTGDGILAFFPEFYTGEDAGFYAASAALECHDLFEEQFKANQSLFGVIPDGAGLGIGIDFGPAHVVRIHGEPTVVGRPVVYACRMGVAPAKNTYVNQQAYQKMKAFEGVFSLEPVTVEIKHMGLCRAHSVSRRGKSYSPKPPAWQRWAELVT